MRALRGHGCCCGGPGRGAGGPIRARVLYNYREAGSAVTVWARTNPGYIVINTIMMRIQLSREFKDQPLLKRVAAYPMDRLRLHNYWIVKK